jgi:hypothetical protein
MVASAGVTEVQKANWITGAEHAVIRKNRLIRPGFTGEALAHHLQANEAHCLTGFLGA